MRNLCFFLFLFTCNLCLAQKVRFQLHIVKPCTGLTVIDTNFTLYPQSLSDTNKYWGKSTVLLPDTGDHQLYIQSDPYAEIPILKIRDTGLYVYIYYQPRLYHYYSGALDDPGYYVYCDNEINGYQEEPYPNRKCRTRGNFVHGRVKDSIVTFYANGVTKKSIRSFRNGAPIQEFDSLGRKTVVAHNKGHYFLTGYRRKEFYADGHTRSNKSKTKELLIISEFYPSGLLQLKQARNSRTAYFENGKPQVAYRWEAKKDKSSGNDRNLYITRTTYDEQGHILDVFVGEIFGGKETRQPDFEAYRVKYDWVVSSEKFENGKVVFSVKNMDSDIYFKKYPDD